MILFINIKQYVIYYKIYYQFQIKTLIWKDIWNWEESVSRDTQIVITGGYWI